MIIDHKRFEKDPVFFVHFPKGIQQTDKPFLALSLRGKNLLQKGELPFFDGGENIFNSLKVNIESGTMDSGALYNLLYGNAPEFFFKIKIPESALNLCSGTAARRSIFGHNCSPLSKYFCYSSLFTLMPQCYDSALLYVYAF